MRKEETVLENGVLGQAFVVESDPSLKSKARGQQGSEMQNKGLSPSGASEIGGKQ